MGPFGGMNQQDARTSIPDNEAFWIENLLLTGKGNLRALWDRGPDRFIASGKTILTFYPFIQNQIPTT